MQYILAHALNANQISTQKQWAKLWCCLVKGHHLQYQFQHLVEENFKWQDLLVTETKRNTSTLFYKNISNKIKLLNKSDY